MAVEHAEITGKGSNVEAVIVAADRALRIAVIETEAARMHRLHHSAPDPEYYEGFLRMVDESSRRWEAARHAWKEYDAVLAQLRAIASKSNQELWTASSDEEFRAQLSLGLPED
jgi:hypothetical protein